MKSGIQILKRKLADNKAYTGSWADDQLNIHEDHLVMFVTINNASVIG